MEDEAYCAELAEKPDCEAFKKMEASELLLNMKDGTETLEELCC